MTTSLLLPTLLLFDPFGPVAFSFELIKAAYFLSRPQNMSSQAEPPPRTPRRSRRPQKKTANRGDRSVSESASNPQPDTRSPAQPIQILRRGAVDTIPAVDGAIISQVHHLASPPQHQTTHGITANGQQAGNESAPEIDQARKPRTKPQTAKHRKSCAKAPQTDTPSSTPRPNTLTPGRTSETPSKAYAGPTFHASPAASSLPLPMFFSKSVPNVDKNTALSQMMEQELSDPISESEGSPCAGKIQPADERHARDESPLDFFFRADREAKGKGGTNAANTSSQTSTLSVADGGHGVPGDLHLRPDRHHSRHSTNGSSGGVFPLEIDGTKRGLPVLESSNSFFKNRDQANATSTGLIEVDDQEAKLKEQTLALKKLLYSAQPHAPSSSSPRSGTITTGLGSPMPKVSQKTSSQSRKSFGPPITSELSKHAGGHQHQADLMALAERQIPAQANQRPPSSSLRKEMMAPSSPSPFTNPEMPMTPGQKSQSWGRYSQKSRAPLDSMPHNKSYESPQQQPDATTDDVKIDAKSIEDELRRILKIDVLGGDKFAAVRS